MPIFEYTCRACQSDCELLIRGGEKPVCPQCGSSKLDKHLSVVAAHVRGSSGSLPVCDPAPSGNCGLPQCGMGGCQFDG